MPPSRRPAPEAPLPGAQLRTPHSRCPRARFPLPPDKRTQRTVTTYMNERRRARAPASESLTDAKRNCKISDEELSKVAALARSGAASASPTHCPSPQWSLRTRLGPTQGFPTRGRPYADPRWSDEGARGCARAGRGCSRVPKGRTGVSGRARRSYDGFRRSEGLAALAAVTGMPV